MNTLSYQFFTDAADAKAKFGNDNLFGGGTANIAFLEGNPPYTIFADSGIQAPNANAHAAKLKATFWIETVKHELTVDPNDAVNYAPYADGNIVPTLLITPKAPYPVYNVMPTFAVLPSPLGPLKGPVTFPVYYTQIQYSQCVNLEFAGSSFPHVSVATLVPVDPISVTIPNLGG